MTARKASQNKLGQGMPNHVIYKDRGLIIISIEGLCVRWNKSGDHYAIMFDRQINIYNVTVSFG